MPYQVIDLDTDEDHGVYETLERARGCVRFDKPRAYSIWRGFMDRNDENTDLEFVSVERVECCEPYDGDDDRVKQGLGQFNLSEVTEAEGVSWPSK